PVLKKRNLSATIFVTTGWLTREPSPFALRRALFTTAIEEVAMTGMGRFDLNSPHARLRTIERVHAHLQRLPLCEREEVTTRLQEKLRTHHSESSPNRLMLTWDEVREMQLNGISVGAHTVNHPMLTTSTESEARAELTRCKEQIEEQISTGCDLFAYPYGAYNASLARLTMASGYLAAFTTVPRFAAAGADPFTIGRLPTVANMRAFKASLPGLFPDLLHPA
ncbi:MAG: polysaccharide deacetylase family protein, partial [Lentisphaeria bacterium]|nr:polysaccharide deacetylase family protein [Lentisphaeria bacterium]